MPEEDRRQQKVTGREGGERTEMPEEDRRQKKDWQKRRRQD
jgi:hypothetical protein